MLADYIVGAMIPELRYDKEVSGCSSTPWFVEAYAHSTTCIGDSTDQHVKSVVW